jgi:dTDP-glucose 4,6-dehydratase
MRLLITGGAGFMGSNFIHYILRTYPDYTVTTLDKLTYSGNLKNLEDLKENKQFRFVKGDIADDKIVESLAKEADVIINYAAETHVDRSIMDPGAFVKTDVIGLYTLLEKARKYNHERFIQISTDEVFGSIEKGKFTENSPFEPNSPYAASKAGGDLLCRSYFVTYKMPVIVTHSCNFFGPYHYPEKFIPLTITNLLQGKKIPVYGDGQQVREWIYTEDHCNAVDTILHKGKVGEVYNISSEEEWKNIDVVNLILKIMEKDESSITYVKDRPGHDRRYALDSSKLKNELGWKPQYSFESALEKTIKWFEENESWWKDIVSSQEYQEYYQKQYGSI